MSVDDLTYLEENIELTLLEKKLIGNPVFQRLREMDNFPFRFGSATSGLKWVYNEKTVEYLPVDPMPVAKVGE